MLKRNIVPRFILSAFALTTLCLLPAVLNAQKAPQGTTDAPLEGAEVRLARYSGAQFASSGSMAAFRVETDEKGNFTFPPVPAGEYTLTVSHPKGASKDTANTPMKGDMSRGHQPDTKRSDNPAAAKFCFITLNLPGGKKVQKRYDLENNREFYSNPVVDRKIKQSAIEDSVGKLFIVVSDGITAATGTIIIRNHNGYSTR